MLNNLDLNLLVALDALLEERSVTRAAERLGLTQPTLSHSLGRLRRHFHDELLYRSGSQYELTPLGVHLSGRTAIALDGVQRIFAAQSTIDPASATRRFTIVCSDYGAALVGPRLTAALAELAPGMRVVFTSPDPTPLLQDDARFRGVDALVMPHGFVRGNVPHQNLFHDRWVCVVSAGNTSVGDRLTMADLSRLPWVASFTGTSPGTTALRQLFELGVEVDIQVTVPGFVTLPMFVAGSDRICLLPRRLADHLIGPDAGLRVLDCPFDPLPLTNALWWHPAYDGDPEHQWLRNLLDSLWPVPGQLITT